VVLKDLKKNNLNKKQNILMAIEFNYRRRIESIITSVAVGQVNHDKDQGVKDGDPHVGDC
jgi:hypothetical protein